MEKLIAILETALPVFLALGLGMICRKTGFLDRKGIDTLKKVVINLTLPAVLLNAFATAEYSTGTLVLPVLVYVLLTCTNMVGQTFLESNMDNYPAEICKAISNDLVEQFVQAEQAGLEYFELHVPVFNKDQNWPLYSGYNGFSIADALYEHGVISRRLEFTAVPTMEMNEKYKLTVLWW